MVPPGPGTGQFPVSQEGHPGLGLSSPLPRGKSKLTRPGPRGRGTFRPLLQQKNGPPMRTLSGHQVFMCPGPRRHGQGVCACVTCGGQVSVSMPARVPAQGPEFWVWPTRRPGGFSSLWVTGICPRNLRRMVLALPQVCQAHHLRLSPVFPWEATEPWKGGGARCSVQAQRGRATCPRPNSGRERPAWSASPWPCSGARLRQVLNDRPAELGRAPRASPSCLSPAQEPA